MRTKKRWISTEQQFLKHAIEKIKPKDGEQTSDGKARPAQETDAKKPVHNHRGTSRIWGSNSAGSEPKTPEKNSPNSAERLQKTVYRTLSLSLSRVQHLFLPGGQRGGVSFSIASLWRRTERKSVSRNKSPNRNMNNCKNKNKPWEWFYHRGNISTPTYKFI